MPLANAGWGWLHLVWSRDGLATDGGVVAVGPGDATELVVAASPPGGPPPPERRLLLKARSGPRAERWRIPSPDVRTVHLQGEPEPEDDTAPEPAACPPPAREGGPAPSPGDRIVVFCEPDRWDAWAVLPSSRQVRRLGGGKEAVTAPAGLQAAWHEARRLFHAWRGSSLESPSPMIVMDDTSPASHEAGLPANTLVQTRSRLALRGWRVRRVPGPEEAFVALLEIGLESITLRLLSRNGDLVHESATAAFSTRARTAVARTVVGEHLPGVGATPAAPPTTDWLAAVALDVLQRPRVPGDLELAAAPGGDTAGRRIPCSRLRRELLQVLDDSIASLVDAPLPHADPVLAFGAALDLEAVRCHLTGRSLRVCPDRAQPLCCLGLLAAATIEPHLELEAVEGSDHVSCVDLPFQLSPGPDRVDLTYELPARRSLTVRLYRRENMQRRLLGETRVAALDRDAILVFLVRETARGRLSIDLHDAVTGCREILAVAPPPGP